MKALVIAAFAYAHRNLGAPSELANALHDDIHACILFHHLGEICRCRSLRRVSHTECDLSVDSVLVSVGVNYCHIFVINNVSSLFRANLLHFLGFLSLTQRRCVIVGAAPQMFILTQKIYDL